MWPTIFEAAGMPPVRSYGLAVLLGFVVAFAIIHMRARRVGIHPDRLLIVYGAAAAGALLGARFFEAFTTSLGKTLSDPLSLFSIDGLTVYGGVIGAVAACFVVARLRGLPVLKLADVMAPPAILGMGVGRVGCLFAGCCHGTWAPVSDAPTPLLPEALHGQLWLDSRFPFLTTSFEAGSVARIFDTPLYPTQLWAVLALCGIAVALMVLWRHRRFDGMIAGIALIAVPISRIVIESFRGDHRGTLFSLPAPRWLIDLLPGLANAGPTATHDAATIGLTTSQTIGVLMIAGGIALLVLRRGTGVSEEVPLEEED